MANTDFVHRTSVLCTLTKNAQCEYGCIGKGPLERPTPSAVIGISPGQKLWKLGEAQKLDTKQLRKICQKMGAKLPPIPGCEMEVAKKRALKCLQEWIGPPLRSVKAYESEYHKCSNRRGLLIQGIMGGLDDSTAGLYAPNKGLPVTIGRAVHGTSV